MNCFRCAGLCVAEAAGDMEGYLIGLVQMRCINCGSRTDPVAGANAVRPPNISKYQGGVEHYHGAVMIGVGR